ncbi:MAG: hypothetical protein NTV65_01505 [Proteobacteria bacterium]|nr:hypothetical protein [Pseudomonadota bacterium]
MPDPITKKLTIAEYKEAQTKLSELMANAVTGFAAAQKVGDLDKAKAWSETLVLPIASLKEQFLQLSPRDQFVSKYSVEKIKINAHQVRFVLPKGVSRIDLLNEAQGIARGLYGRDAVWPDQLKDWQKEDDFRTKTTSTTKLGIDGRVKELDAKSREEQESVIGEMAPLADLAVAHTAFFILTGKDLFQGQFVRACGGALYFDSDGLDVNDSCGDFSIYVVSASRSLPSTNKKLDP